MPEKGLENKAKEIHILEKSLTSIDIDVKNGWAAWTLCGAPTRLGTV
jgi:hypothetical protein